MTAVTLEWASDSANWIGVSCLPYKLCRTLTFINTKLPYFNAY